MTTLTTKRDAAYELRKGLLYVDGVLCAADPLAVEATIEAWNAGATERLDVFCETAVRVPAELGALILHVALRLAARPEPRRLPRAAAL